MSDWVLPEDEAERQPTHHRPAAAAAAGGEWELPDEGRAARPVDAVSTGPSGLLLGEAPATQASRGGPVSIRLFRATGSKLVVAVPEYITWLLAFRSISLGAHLSIISSDPRRWEQLVGAVRSSGGTADLLGPYDRPPSAGRPYRPSLVVDAADYFDGIVQGVGPWQATLVVQSVATAAAVFALRSCDLALVAPWDQRVAEQCRRAYALNPAQVKACGNLAQNEIVVARPRRVVRVAVPPTPTEYQLLFA